MSAREQPPEPPERHETPRQALERHLRRRTLTAGELAGILGMRERDVVGHLEHLERSVRRHGARLVCRPARCLACGYGFPGRRRLSKPGSCPRCHRQQIDPPAFRIEAAG